MIHCQTSLFKIGSWTILRLPDNVSAELPSRGQVMVEGTINGHQFRAALEPDGKWSHWLNVDETLQKTIGADVGDTVTLDIEPSKAWPEPDLPVDWQKALTADKQAFALWAKVTPMARWEWIRWIRATGRAEIRARRIEVALSKLKNGERRPCCWNRNLCTEPAVSKNGILLDPTRS